MGAWVAVAILCALSLAASDTITKHAQGRLKAMGGDCISCDYAVAWLRVAMCLPLGLLMLPFIEIPKLDSTFWWALAGCLPLEVVALYLYTRALRVSPMSLTLPFQAFTPAFIIGTAYLLLGERISAPGLLGIALMVAGGYALNIDKMTGGLLGPVRAVWHERGSLMMLAVAVIFSMTATLLKVCINHSSVMFVAATYYGMLVLAVLPFAARQLPRVPRQILPAMAASGALQFLMIVTNMVAFSMTTVAYAVSVKRTSLLMGVAFGYLFFKEDKIFQRGTGALLMFAGFVVIALSG